MKLIYTSDMIQIEDAVIDLAEVISQSQTAQNYQKYRQEMANDVKAIAKRKLFLEAKRQYDKVADYGEYASGYKEARLNVRKAKRQLDLDQHVAAFRIAENDLQQILDIAALKIASEVSKTIKVDSGNPFFSKKHSGCGGHCHE